MKSEELMIGDWVAITEPDDFHGYIGKVAITNAETNYIMVHISNMHLHDVFVEDLQPIELTEEILKKNGFENIPYAGIDCNKVWLLHEISYYGKSFPLHTNDIMLRYNILNHCWSIFFNIGGVHSDFRTVTTIFYVHELQHLLKICKIEKEIVL